MTNINCSYNCVFQKDGKCNLNVATVKHIDSFNDCAYFISNIPLTK